MPPEQEEEVQDAAVVVMPGGSPSLQEPLLAEVPLSSGEEGGCGSGNGDGGRCSHRQQQQHQQSDVSDVVVLDKDIALPSCCCSKGDGTGSSRTTKVNHNVLLNLVVCLLFGLSDSLWNGTANAAYLKKLGGNRNGPLGDVEAVQGLASLLTALPVGYAADKIGRSKVIAAGGVLTLLTIAGQVGLMEWIGRSGDFDDDADGDGSHRGDNSSRKTVGLWIFGLIMFFWGTANGVVNGPASALYADSTPEGNRSDYYNYLFACYMGASAVGPLVSIVLFQTLGNDWDVEDLSIVIYVGLGFAAASSVLMLFFDDRKALEHTTAATAAAVEPAASISTSESQPATLNPEGDNDEEQAQAATSFVPAAREQEGGRGSDSTMTPLERRRQWIPYIIFAQGLIFAVGSGMTVKFFPLFFKDEVGMTPSQVQIIYVSVPIFMVLMSTVITKLASAGFGRVQSKLLFAALGVSCLYSMVIFKTYLDVHPWFLVPIYVMRTSLINCSYPLQESILMDYVPPDRRARWKSLESVSAFGWCGSAAFGGWLADRYDYTYTFAITAVVQTVGIAIWSLLLPLVPRKEGSHDDESSGGGTTAALAEPLLPQLTGSSDHEE